jgi:hypothetical protein
MYNPAVPDYRVDYNSVTSNGIGAVPSVAGIAAAREYGNGHFHRTIIDITALRIAMTDGGASGSIGSQKIYDFPEGNIIILGAVTKWDTMARVGTAIAATAVIKHALGGTAEATNDTLDSVQAEILPSTSSAAMVAGVAAAHGGASTAPVTKDGTTTPIDAILNIGIADAGSTGNDSLDVTGRIELTWINLGDHA